MSELELLKCNICGGELTSLDESTYRCECCGNLFATKQESLESSLKEALGEEKYARVSAARQNLWAAMHEEYVSSSSCLEYARDLKSLVPSDYYANFAETANSKNDADLSKFLNSSSAEDMETYADAVLDFMLKSLTAGTLTAVCAYIDRAYKKSSPEYVKYEEAFEREAEKVSRGVYELSMERDVFLAYSSADTGKVIELCDFLESQGVTCFLSMRNLRHGRGAADNYDAALREAMDNCRTVVFLSSKSSRNLSCDALRKELPYMRTRDMEFAPSEYKNLSYDKLPARYKKPRVEYLLDDYTGTTADALAKQIFDGYEWCKSKEEVAERVVGYLTAVPMTGSSPIGEEEVRKIVSSMSEGKDASVPLETKEKNILEHVSKLVEIGSFDEALKNLTDLEKVEIEAYGKASAGVYYYKILSRHGAKGFKEIVKTVTSTGATLRNDADYRLAMTCGDGEYKDKIKEIEIRCEEINAQAKLESEEKRRKTEQARLEDEERRREEAEVRRKLRIHRFTEVVGIVIAAYVVIGIVGIILAFTVPNMTGSVILLVLMIVAFVTLMVLLCLSPSKKAKESGTMSAAGEAIVAMPTARRFAGIGVLIVITVGCLFGFVLLMPIFSTRVDGVEYIYAIRGNYCYVSGYTGDSSGIVIPSEYDGKKVTEIRSDAFKDNTTVTSIIIPSTVTKIGSNAFEGCSLETVSMSGGVKTIGEDAFLRCGYLESIDLTGVKKIGDNAFGACASLKEVTLSEGLRTIGEDAFYNCLHIEEITIPASVKKIGAKAFYGCNFTYVYFTDPTGWKRAGEKVNSDILTDPTSAASLFNNEEKNWKH